MPVVVTNRGKGPFLNAKAVPLAVIALTLVVIAVLVFLSLQNFRRQLRAQIAGRDAQIIYALWQSQHFPAVEDAEFEAVANTGDSADQLVAVLETSQLPQLRGVLATRLFDRSGLLVIAFPPNVPDASIPAVERAPLEKLQPASHLRTEPVPGDREWLESSFPNSGLEQAPLLEIRIPLHKAGETNLLGIAEFILDGRPMADEFARLDRRLIWQAGSAFTVGSSIVALILAWSFHYLQKANRLLQDRTQSLLRANQELTLAAKTSAVGAVTAHLIHGLKNPLSGLQAFMNRRSDSVTKPSDTEWQLAITTTQRMQGLISDVVRVLREENGAGRYELSLEELTGLLASKLEGFARRGGVAFQVEVSGEVVFSNREANLILLILENVVQNAIQATPAGRSVKVKALAQAGRVSFEIEDQGPGIRPELASQLFVPCQSSKPGGSGIGLAISRQLSTYLGASLELVSNSPEGCRFVLTLEQPPSGVHEKPAAPVSQAASRTAFH